VPEFCNRKTQFQSASDAVCAALALQAENTHHIDNLGDDIRPEIRVEISLGEVVVTDNTVTGAGVVLAQRLEPLAAPGAVAVQGAVAQAVPNRLPFDFDSLSEQILKGFDQPVRAFAVEEARRICGELRETNPRYCHVDHLARLPFNDSSDAEKILEGLRKAGLAE